MELDQAEHQKGNRIRPAKTDADKEAYKKNGQCFRCGNKGHLSKFCPHKPTSNNYGSNKGHVSVLEKPEPLKHKNEEQLLKFKGQIKNQQATILIDSRASRNFINKKFAQTLRLKIHP